MYAILHKTGSKCQTWSYMAYKLSFAFQKCNFKIPSLSSELITTKHLVTIQVWNPSLYAAKSILAYLKVTKY